ncbi:MAG: hypothetical protein J07AB43_02060 [Candidatus Nanosalina sp. J07AB43]|jgi:hypothetical protein|nr:MAG: hypothetical protein J07AB43_02060 [Candidatus Nanosalina sp. J07AB43]
MGLEQFSSGDQSREAEDNKLTEAEIYRMFLETAEKCGESFTLADLRRENNGIHHTTIKEYTDKTFNGVKEHLSLKQNMRSAPSKNEASNELAKLDKPVTKSKVDEHCTFSAGTVSKKYGDGSFVNGLISLGIEVTDKQIAYRNANERRNNNSGKSYKYWSNLVKTHPDYDKNADAFVYVLKCTRSSDGRVFWYVGQVEEGSSLTSRVYEHSIKKGCFQGVETLDRQKNGIEESDIISNNAEFNIELDSIRPLYKYELSSEQFQKVLSRVEFKTILRTALDKDSTDVIGKV